MQNPDRSIVLQAVNKLESALFHLKQTSDAEGKCALQPVQVALDKLKQTTLHDVVFASTGCEDVGGGNIMVGVTAHCRCGHSFPYDVTAIGVKYPGLTKADQAAMLLWKCYKVGHREGWEDGQTTTEVMDEVHAFMCNNFGNQWQKTFGVVP